MTVLDKDLAGGGVLGSHNRTQLFAGDAPVNTSDAFVVASGQGALAKYTVVAVDPATSKLIAHDPSAAGGAGMAKGILTQAVDATTADAKVAIYTAGSFNHEALVWDANLTDFAARAAAFAGTPIQIGAVRL